MRILILCEPDSEENRITGNTCAEHSELSHHTSVNLCIRLINVLRPMCKEINLCDTVPQLITCLRMPQISPSVIIMVIDSHDTLEALISVKTFFEDIPVIVVLTFENQQTVNRIHTLGPRYVSHCDGDISDVVEVVANLGTR